MIFDKNFTYAKIKLFLINRKRRTNGSILTSDSTRQEDFKMTTITRPILIYVARIRKHCGAHLPKNWFNAILNETLQVKVYLF